MLFCCGLTQPQQIGRNLLPGVKTRSPASIFGLRGSGRHQLTFPREALARDGPIRPCASPVTYGVAPIALSASSTSGLTVVFSVSSGPASISGSTLTITGAGTVVVAADQSGNANYAAATEVTHTITVNKGVPAAGLAASASGFTNGTGNLSLYPSGLGFDTASFSVTTQATPTSLTIGMNMLTPNTLTFAGQGFLGPQAAASRTPSLAGRPPPAQLPAAQLQSCNMPIGSSKPLSGFAPIWIAIL